METKLSAELQELYLLNKEWMSQVLFLEDESRFFSKLFRNRLFHTDKAHTTAQANLISESLTLQQERTVKLKELVIKHQHVLEQILKDEEQFITMGLIEENAAITLEIQELLYTDRLLKSELFALVENESDVE